MRNILVIKTAATGDVVRTTTLLHCFREDSVWWITSRMNADILPKEQKCLKHVIAIEDFHTNNEIKDITFDLVLSLDDDKASIEIIKDLNYKKLTGAYRDKETDKITYTEDSAHWFDLSLISHFTKEEADRMKFEGKLSVQAHLFKMIGENFTSQEYLIYEGVKANPDRKLIGIEARSGERWPTKRWNGYEEFAERLKKEGYEVVFFEQRNSFKEYMEDIAKCGCVICGDTLGMHLALALKIPTIAIFTCTSADEIYDYSIMEKVVSPYLWDAFFKTTYVAKAVEAITQEMVWEAFKRIYKL